MNSIRTKLFDLLISARPLLQFTLNVRKRNLMFTWHSLALNTDGSFRSNVWKGNNLPIQNIYVTSHRYYSKNTSHGSLITPETSSASELTMKENVCDSVALLEEECSFPVSENEDWSSEMKWIKSQESKDVLSPPKDLSEIDNLSPELRPTFNLAAYANRSHTLQQLIKLGVDLSNWDKRKHINSFILKLDFERDMKKYLMFLHDVGVEADDLGKWLTVNPLIFKENLENLQVRLDYLHSMNFSPDQITRIISKNPNWLLFSTVRIDNRLGYFQRTFHLTGAEVRLLATKQPKLITMNLFSIKRTSFAIEEEMGFSPSEMKSLLLSQPKIWRANGVSLLRRFEIAHNQIGLSHSQIVQFPQILMSRDFRIKQRHDYLKLIGRDQYDPLKPNYVSPSALVSSDDVEFCTTIAKTSVQNFNDFLKTR
ncbi:transcription termination factor 3, mitochondrial [Cherax quadricarinatus]|nr:transcription termination factor 3, mitochondrial-like [Cherax quadricarinatus]